MDPEATVETEPKPARGVFARQMAEISQRASEWRAQAPRTPSGELMLPMMTPPDSSLKPERIAELRGLPRRRWETTFDSFDLGLAPMMAAAFTATKAMADGTARRWCLVLCGTWGTGKTHLAYAAANYRREHGLPYRFITVPALLALIRTSIDEKREAAKSETIAAAEVYGPEDWVKSFGETSRMLILDDFGAQQETDFGVAQLFAILDARYDRRLPTLMTTNRRKSELDPRIASRCAGGIVVCNGDDQRARFS